MNLRTPLRLGAVAGLLLAGLVPLVPAAAAPVAPAAPSAEPQIQYLYGVTFTAAVTYGLRVERGGPNHDATKLSTTLTGTLPNVQVASGNTYSLEPKGPASSAKVRTSNSAADTTIVSDEGLHVDRCIGNVAEVNGRPVLRNELLEPLYLFGDLQFPTACTDNQGTPSTARYFLPQVTVDLLSSSGRVGDKTYTIKVFGDAAEPPGFPPNPTLCHGYEPGMTTSCSYQVKGTLTLKLIKKLGSQDSSKGASVTPAKATAKVMCPARCTIRLSLTQIGRAHV